MSAEGEAFARTLYERHGEVLLRFATRLCRGDRHLAEDIVQEAVVRAWRNREVLDPARPEVRPWLFRVVRNLVIDSHRAHRARPVEAADAEPVDLPVPDPAELTTVLFVVAEAMADLPEWKSEILVRLYYYGESVAQVAEVLGIPQGTVKSRAFYALRTLRDDLRKRGLDAGAY